MKKKSLKEIVWDVSEETYRNDPALSYSTIAKFYRNGFDRLESLFEKQSTASLTFGSAVDCIITEGMDVFHDRFDIVDYNITASGLCICMDLAHTYAGQYAEFKDIPQSVVSESAKNVGFWKDPKWDSRRYKEVLNTGDVDTCYRALSTTDKTVIDSATYAKVIDAVDALKTSKSTAKYFVPDLPFDDDVEHLYQLKFKQYLHEDVEYRCMMDLVIVDHKNKIIQPIDLKTSSKPEHQFFKSFVEWNYDMQARLYYRLLKKTIESDEYFKDFTINDYLFIVVNKDSLKPLVWEYDKTKQYGTIRYSGDWNVTFVDPEYVGKDLRQYLDYTHEYPIGITEDKPNNIVEKIIKEITRSYGNN